MADDKDGGAEGVDELVLKPEDQVIDEPDNQQEVEDPIAKLASDMGWAPKDEFKGDPEKWKPADEFIRAGHDIQRTTAKELRGLRSTVETMQRTSATLVQQQVEAEKKRLETQFHQAVEEGNSSTAFEIGRQIDRLGSSANPPPTFPETEDFVERHSNWFNRDPLATQLAVDTCERLSRMGYSPAQQLEQAERAVKKQFPELFPAPAKQQAATHDSRRTTAPSNRKKGFSDLPAEAQAVARDLVDKGLIPSTDIYATNFFAEQAKAAANPRRVG